MKLLLLKDEMLYEELNIQTAKKEFNKGNKIYEILPGDNLKPIEVYEELAEDKFYVIFVGKLNNL